MTQINSIDGVKEILSKLEDDDLYSLAVTVTQGYLKNKISSRNEAIDAIVKYSDSESSILRRKVMTRDILFSYLHDKNVPITLPVTKFDLIEKILVYWNVPRAKTLQLDQYTSSSLANSETESNYSAYEDNLSNRPQISNSSSEIQEINKFSNEICVEKPENNVKLLAQAFSKWFYEMINTDEGVGPEHFYPDSTFKINLFQGENCDNETIENNPQEIVDKLKLTRLQHNLYFNPNISSEGIQGRMDPHGLVLVLACGTLHVNSICVGVFEQVFALARDPFCDNNWKIKNSQLNLRSSNNIRSPPRLCDSELTSNLLCLPES